MAVGKLILDTLATAENFDEDDYLAANPDVRLSISGGALTSGRQHFELFGAKEGRQIRLGKRLLERKKHKLMRIESLLRSDMTREEHDGRFDFLTPALKQQFDIVDVDAVSSHGYDDHAQSIIDGLEDGFVLDCGAGKRPVYYDQVVNFEIVAYDTTDVRGVGEVLPFQAEVFDAVLSVAVLEHVKDPQQCAREIIRVLKPGGILFCAVPFLQPLHAYPHHYYNMTADGLRNLFQPHINVDQHQVYHTGLPIWSLNWVLNSWASGLSGDALREFTELSVKDLMQDPETLGRRRFCTELPEEKNFELACSTVMIGRKRNPA